MKIAIIGVGNLGVSIAKVTTPNGCTIEGLNEMEHQGLSSSIIHGMVASFEKINGIKEGA